MRGLFCIFVLLTGMVGVTPAKNVRSLEELVAPVAFFPDPLLAHVFAASTYPAEVIAASRRSNPASADAGEVSMSDQRWAPEVKSLAHAPLLLQWMEANTSWMVQLGNAFLKDSSAILEAVQSVRLQALSAGTLLTVADFLVEVEDGFLLVRSLENGDILVPPLDRKDWSSGGDWKLAGAIPPNLIFLEIDWKTAEVRVREPQAVHPWIADHPVWRDEEMGEWRHAVPHRLGVLYPVPSVSLDDLDLSFEVNWSPGYQSWPRDFPVNLRMPLMPSRIPAPDLETFEVDDLLPDALPPRPLPSINRLVQWPDSPRPYLRLVDYAPGGGVEQWQVFEGALEPRGNLAFCSIASMLGRRLLSTD